MKLLENPIFIIISLCLCFPIGIIFLLLSNQTRGRKLLFAIIGTVVFTLLLSLALLPCVLRNSKTPSFRVNLTKTELHIGESGGFSITDGNILLADFDAKTDENILKISNNTYTALKSGEATLTIIYNGKNEEFKIKVTDTEDRSDIVFLSPKAKRYHSHKSHAGKNAVEMTEEEAILSGKTPCKICYKK